MVLEGIGGGFVASWGPLKGRLEGIGSQLSVLGGVLGCWGSLGLKGRRSV